MGIVYPLNGNSSQNETPSPRRLTEREPPPIAAGQWSQNLNRAVDQEAGSVLLVVDFVINAGWWCLMVVNAS